MANYGQEDLARKLNEEFPDAFTLTLAKRLYRENVSLFKDIEAARSAMRRVRGTHGKLHRKTSGLKEPLKLGYAGMKPELPPSDAEKWEPLILDLPCRVLCLSDAHIPYHDDKAIQAAVAYGKKLKPDVLLLNGDWCDFYSISRWDKQPSMRNFSAEIDAVQCSIEWLSKQFPKARKIFKMGNHEERYNQFIWNKAPELFNVASCELREILSLSDDGFECVGDERPIIAGHLPIFHGHELPKGISSPVNAARGAYMRMGGTVAVGHHHRTSVHTEPNWKGDEITCWSQGCLCDMRPKYARINKWNHGFLFAEAEADGQFDVNNYRISSDYQVRAS